MRLLRDLLSRPQLWGEGYLVRCHGGGYVAGFREEPCEAGYYSGVTGLPGHSEQRAAA